MSARILVAGAAFTLGAALLGGPATASPMSSSTSAPGASAALTAARPTAAPAFAASAIKWGRCKDSFVRDAGGRCGMLTVPLDHADPTGPTIELAVSRVKHKGAKYRGVMFTNPGGPGGAGTYLAAYGQFVPGKVGESYDWIGMDPRGVGDSKPALTCDKRINKLGTRPPYDPTTDAITEEWVARTEAYAADCGTSAAASLLPHMKTTDTVADFEVLREALGADKVSFYGFSYGTYIAQVYANLHPLQLDKLVLDGVVDPRGIWYASNASQNDAFEKSIQGFYRWAARGNKDFRLGNTAARVEKTYYRVLRKLAVKPINGVGAAELSDVALGAGYVNFLWPDVAAVISEIKTKGTAKLARASYLGDNAVTNGGDNGYATYLATLCTDAPWPTDLDAILADNAAQAGRSPFVTWANAWFNAPCRTWPAAPAAAAFEVAEVDRSALLINETFDGATPLSGALEVRRRFSGAVLIEGVKGTTHAGSLSGVGCVDNKIAAYLANGKLPERRTGDRADVRCPAVAAPPAGEPDARLGTNARPRLPLG